MGGWYPFVILTYFVVVRVRQHGGVLSGLGMCWHVGHVLHGQLREHSLFPQDMSGTIDALIGHLQAMGRTDAVNLMQIAVKEYGGSDSASANSGPMLGMREVLRVFGGTCTRTVLSHKGHTRS